MNKNNDSLVAWAWDAGSSNTSISAGSLNSSAYNTSRTWSDGIANSNSDFDQAKTNAFNGDRSNKLRTGGNSVLVTLNFSPALTVSSTIEILAENWPTSNHRYTVTVDGTTTTKDVTGSPATFNVSGSLTQITVDNNSSGGRTYLEWIKVDGKELIDSNVTPPNVPSIASTVRANPSAGFSIVSWTGNGTSGATLGHELNAAPKMVIFKNRDTANTNWRVYNTMVDGSLDWVYLNTTAAKSDSSLSLPTSTVFTAGGSNDTNGNGNAMIAYCFSPVEGYSSFGSYEGNGSDNGSYVFLGFRPAFLMIKRTDAVKGWMMIDSTRNPSNVIKGTLYPNLSDAEYTGSGHEVDFLSNGFKCRKNNDRHNASGGTYLYVAFAENPFKYSRAR